MREQKVLEKLHQSVNKMADFLKIGKEYKKKKEKSYEVSKTKQSESKQGSNA